MCRNKRPRIVEGFTYRGGHARFPVHRGGGMCQPPLASSVARGLTLLTTSSPYSDFPNPPGAGR